MWTVQIAICNRTLYFSEFGDGDRITPKVDTAIVLATGLLTTSGNLALILAADFVFVFALLQALGIVRIRKSQPAC